MTLEANQAKRVRDLLASALAQEQNAFEMLCKYMIAQGLHVDDLGIGNDAGAGPVGGLGGGGQDEVGGTGSEEENFILAWLCHEEVRCAYDNALTWRQDAADPNDPLSRVGRQPLTLRRIVRGLTKDAARNGLKLSRRLIDAVLAG